MTPIHSLMLNIVFITLGGFFHLAEYLYPDHMINHRHEFKKDILAFVLLSMSGILISTPLINYYRSLDMSFLSALHNLNSFTKVILATLITDFLNYWIHYYMHKKAWYWKAHVHHHRVENLYWFSGLRASFGHYVSFILSRVTVGILLFNLSSGELFVYLSIGLFTNFYQHTNARIGHRYVEWILVTPRVHRLHHASNGSRMKNIATIFSFWDRVFGTYLDPETYPLNYELGVKTEKKSEWREIIGL
ncbi:MAG: sterol desaturase family protein [Bacteriovorax sp.]|nr:sterol desaturase family protein [Bacteriovorax sp.]